MNRYFVRVKEEDSQQFVAYLTDNMLKFNSMHGQSYWISGSGPTNLYLIDMDESTALSMKLTWKTQGFFKF